MTILLAALLLSQNFDAASVKPGPPANTGRFSMTEGPGTPDPTFLRYSNVPLKRVLMVAYDAKYWQISGPEWLDTLRFDLSARVPEGATKDDSAAMLRSLIADRFQMTMHRAAKQMAFYAMVVDKGGSKLKTASETAPAADDIATVKKDRGTDGFPVLKAGAPGLVIETRNGRARITAFQSGLSKLADLLSNQTGRPVFDETGIPGIFDFILYFTPETSNPQDMSPYPALFDALREQLGLRLEARKGPVDLLIIDRIEKIPTGNE